MQTVIHLSGAVRSITIWLIHRHNGWFVGEHGVGGSEYSVALLAMLLVWLFTTLAVGPDGQPMFVIHLPPGTAAYTALLATVCGVLAALAPARRAARMDPAQAIRL